VEVVSPRTGGNFNPPAIYRREAPGVVTVTSVFPGPGGGLFGRGAQQGVGSGFVVSSDGEIATNAHVVTNGTGASIHKADQVFVDFADGNKVPARIVGYDPNADVALLRVKPDGLTLRPLPLGSSSHIVVGAPVAAIGSPFDEPQSLSVGVISATDRSIDSLTGFQIAGALQTDAAINHGNSGGPLVDAQGRVIGINSQIDSSSGGGSGVGFAVPVDTVKRSLAQLRASGHVRYAYLGVSTAGVFPQLAKRYHLPVTQGAYVQNVSHGGPAAAAGIRGGDRTVTFQARPYRVGGDIITAVGGVQVHRDSDLAQLVTRFVPGQHVTLTIWHGAHRRMVQVKLGTRPLATAPLRLP
jgi:S1-C subfamily serine protease